MLKPSWIFVAASLIAVVGIVFCFKKFMNDIQRKMDNKTPIRAEAMQKENSRFFISVAIVEIIPVILIVIGFLMIDSLSEALSGTEAALPLLIIAAIFLFGVINMVLTNKETLTVGTGQNEEKQAITTFTFIGIALTSSIPIVSVIATFMMTA
ncbi:hypothetical protein GCM10010954_26510 [Halobacillus andaensis]|uniref:Uncharacterized protein n=1 Tax=Halobacillus andaensis TaxID=1176239 RepID=A0A917EYT9_HALAA|nr:hypothetical protein [Halobacillus andaensis]MBP2005764.1 putative Tic20 family protein [Halobacillus andaensis]GGF26199.1 hypothetical protein GCM10010954_26510 [Halobacillus andaensis]